MSKYEENGIEIDGLDEIEVEMCIIPPLTIWRVRVSTLSFWGLMKAAV